MEITLMKAEVEEILWVQWNILKWIESRDSRHSGNAPVWDLGGSNQLHQATKVEQQFKELLQKTIHFREGQRNRGGNAGRPAPFRPAPHKARISRAGPPRPTHFMRATYSGPRARGPARFFFFKIFYLFIFFMIKLSMFKNWETLRSSQN